VGEGKGVRVPSQFYSVAAALHRGQQDAATEARRRRQPPRGAAATSRAGTGSCLPDPADAAVVAARIRPKVGGTSSRGAAACRRGVCRCRPAVACRSARRARGGSWAWARRSRSAHFTFVTRACAAAFYISGPADFAILVINKKVND
jgi:hypothetical protein